MFDRKKMNFTTDLPKRNPLVSYIVASAMRCEKFFPESDKNGGPVFRMHAVILKTGFPTVPKKQTKAQQQAAAASGVQNQSPSPAGAIAGESATTADANQQKMS